MSKSHLLAVTIGAVLQNSFKSVMGESTSQISRLGSTIRKMETDSKRINTFKGISADVGLAKRAWHDAENQVRQLALGISSSDAPTKEMQANFEKSKLAAGRAKDTFLKKREALNKVRVEMVAAGQTSIGLAAQQMRLGSSVDRLKLKYTALDSVISKHKTVLAKRTELRAQIFDTIALGAALVTPIKSAAKFETSMFEVKEALRDLPEKDATKVVTQLGSSIKNLTRTLPFTADQLAIMAATGGKMGIATGKLGEFIEVTAKMATVFGMSAEDSSESIAEISKAFNIPLNKISNLSDAINQLSDSSTAKAGDIFKAMAKAGGAAIQFGLAEDKVAALASSFIFLGKEPRAASSAMNSLFTNLGNVDKQSDKFKEGLSALGFEASDFQESVKKDAAGALLSFLQAANEAEDSSALLFDMFGGSADDVSLLVQRLDVYKDKLNVLKDESGRAGATEREFAEKMKHTTQQFSLFTNAINTLGINIGSVLLPAINSVLGSFSTVIGVVTDVTDKFPILAKVVLWPVFGLIALKIAAIGLGFAWTFVTGGALLVRKALLTIGIEATLTSIKFLGLNKITLLTNIRLKALAFGSVIVNIFKAFGTALVFTTTRLAAFNIVAAITYIRTKSLAIGQVLIGAWGVLGNIVAFASARLLTFNAVSLITVARIRLFAIGGIITSFAGGLITLASAAIPVVIGALRTLTVALMTNPIGLVIGGIAIAAGLVIANWDKVKNFFATIWGPIKPAWEAFANWIGNFWKIISTPFAAIGKVFEFLFGSNKSLNANITGSQEAANAPETNINSSLPAPEIAGRSFIATAPEIPATNIAGIAPLQHIQNTTQSFANPIIPNQRIAESKTINQNIKIEVNAAPGQDIKSIAEEVMRKIKELSRGALFDTAGAAL